MADPSSSRSKPPDPPPPPPTPAAPPTKRSYSNVRENKLRYQTNPPAVKDPYKAKDKGKKVVFASPDIPPVDMAVVHAVNDHNISLQNAIPAENSVVLHCNTEIGRNANNSIKDHAMSTENRNAENVPGSSKEFNPSHDTSKSNDEQAVINVNTLNTHMISNNDVS
ncbi:hypothetical protein Salat_1683500 [Sesamum alatum]|uniref:Uncharacterized protein n=1 Tax=Sesamum alatum TaxID=300844 RepID=A0AAE1Y726_9LAMI|nr:hypothetical protein Salat_1683500 [Sesamum alatum]